MLKKYRNGFIKIIEEGGLDPLQFMITEKDAGREQKTILNFSDSGLLFYAAVAPQNHHIFRCNYTTFNPQNPWRFAELPNIPHYNSNIEEVYIRFGEWLQEVRSHSEESLEPDLWEQIETQKRLVTATSMPNEDKSPFTEEQKAQLRIAVSEFRMLVAKNFQPADVETEVINERLDYLAEAVERLNRFDWKALALSTLVSISIALSLNTEQGQKLFSLFMKVLKGVVHLLQ